LQPLVRGATLTRVFTLPTAPLHDLTSAIIWLRRFANDLTEHVLGGDQHALSAFHVLWSLALGIAPHCSIALGSLITMPFHSEQF